MTDEPDIQKVSGLTPDFQTELARKLSEFAPEIIADGKIDAQKLKELLEDDTTDDSERFGLFWPGKKRAMRAAQEPTTATLKPAKEESKDWETTQNLFIEGDNLEILKVLQKHYHNKIKIIYIDPPYNTGKDFVYPDNYKEGLASYLEFTKQVDSEGRKISTNSDTDGRYHSNWLNMMYPRLKLARNLLTDDGVIFISIGDDEYENLKKICNEIFGEDKYIDTFIVRSNPRGNQAKKFTASQHEYVVAYARDINNISPLGHMRTDDEYNKNDHGGLYREIGLRKRGAGSRRIDAPNQYYPIYYSLVDEKVLVSRISDSDIEIYPMLSDGTEGRWRWAIKTVSENSESLIAREVRKKDGSKGYDIFEKDYYDSDKNVKLKSLLVEKEYNYENATDDIRKLFNGRKVFPYTKPKELILNLIESVKLSSGDIILDFFAGSSTTAHAVMIASATKHDLRFIMVQLPEPIDPTSIDNKDAIDFCEERGLPKNIASISKERICLSAIKVLDDYSDLVSKRHMPVDFGFKVFKLADSNFTKWRPNSDTDRDSLQQHLLDIRESSNDAASEEDLLFEVLLKQGISLTSPLNHIDIDGLSCWVVGANTVAAYLNERKKPSLDQLRSVIATEPAKFIILEDAFQGDDELKTNLVQICKSQKIELWTV